VSRPLCIPHHSQSLPYFTPYQQLFHFDSVAIFEMVSFTSIVTAAVAATGALAAPAASTDLIARQSTPSSTGTHNGCYYSFWTDGASKVTYNNGNAGSYSVSWGTGGNFVGGKGWNPGSAR
jgi:endo-1,4-beta-xylanase